jgi:hypothetical protein
VSFTRELVVGTVEARRGCSAGAVRPPQVMYRVTKLPRRK